MRKMREIARICLIVENTGLDPLCSSHGPRCVANAAGGVRWPRRHLTAERRRLLRACRLSKPHGVHRLCRRRGVLRRPLRPGRAAPLRHGRPRRRLHRRRLLTSFVGTTVGTVVGRAALARWRLQSVSLILFHVAHTGRAAFPSPRAADCRCRRRRRGRAPFGRIAVNVAVVAGRWRVRRLLASPQGCATPSGVGCFLSRAGCPSPLEHG